MKAFRWILYALVCFGIGTGVAFAMNPPAAGVPGATANKLIGDLDAINRYAADGKCSALAGRLDGAQSRIDKLPSDTSQEVITELQRSLDKIRTAAQQRCRQVEADNAAAEQELLEETTPVPTTPEPEPEPTTPDPGGNEGGPDPGTGEGTTTPGDGDGTSPGDDESGNPGGAPIPDQIGAIGRDMRERAKEAREDARRLRQEFKDAFGDD